MKISEQFVCKFMFWMQSCICNHIDYLKQILEGPKVLLSAFFVAFGFGPHLKQTLSVDIS